VTTGLCTMMERLSESGRSHCRNRHVTNSYLCYQCYWLSSIRISRPGTLLPSFPSFFITSLVLLQICKPDDILYRIMGYVRRINYTMRPRLREGRRGARKAKLRAPRAHGCICSRRDECSSIKKRNVAEKCARVENYVRATFPSGVPIRRRNHFPSG